MNNQQPIILVPRYNRIPSRLANWEIDRTISRHFLWRILDERRDGSKVWIEPDDPVVPEEGGICSPLGCVLMDWLGPHQAFKALLSWNGEGVRPEDMMELAGFVGASNYEAH